MASKAGNAGSDAEVGRPRIATPRGELARIRALQAGEASEARDQIMESLLAVCGEQGYRDLSVQEVIDHYGGYRLQFYRHFASKADCYRAAYEKGIEDLCATLLTAAGAEPDWRRGLRAALRALGEFAREQPAPARALLVEVHIAGEPALVKREEVFERLSRAVDTARRENNSRHSPPPLTAEFMVRAIDSAVAMALANREPESFAEAIPDLSSLVVGAYLGEAAAKEELAETRAA